MEGIFLLYEVMRYRHFIFSFFLVVTCTTASIAQTEYPYGKFEISKGYEFAFTTIDTEFDMLRDPVIIIDGIPQVIKDHSSASSMYSFISVSPNKRYIIIDDIIIGYAEDGETRFLHENYMCAVVDVKTQQIVASFQGACAGEWNNQNKFIYADEVYFDGSVPIPGELQLPKTIKRI